MFDAILNKDEHETVTSVRLSDEEMKAIQAMVKASPAVREKMVTQFITQTIGRLDYLGTPFVLNCLMVMAPGNPTSTWMGFGSAKIAIDEGKVSKTEVAEHLLADSMGASFNTYINNTNYNRKFLLRRLKQMVRVIEEGRDLLTVEDLTEADDEE